MDGAWAQADAQLRRRHDLVSILVETMEGHAVHERQALEAVAATRSRAVGARTPADQMTAENLLSGALRSLLAVAEAYPRPEGRPELRQAAGGTGHHREPDRLLPAVLQRRRSHLQQRDPDGPGQHRGECERLFAARILPRAG